MADETYPIPPQYDPYLDKVGQVATSGMSLGSLRNPPVRMIVEQQIKELEAQVAERKALLEDLNNNPGVEKILDRMRKMHL